jgi:sulfur carrier protein ThiS
MSASFEIRVKLAEPFRSGVGEELIITTPISTLGQLIPILEARVPDFSEDDDDGYVFAVNGNIILYGTRAQEVQSGDEVELMLALSGG